MSERNIPTRNVSSRISSRSSYSSNRNRVTPQQRAKEQQQLSETINNIKTNVSSFANSISNLNNASTEAKTYYNNNINNVPIALRSQFKTLLSQSLDNIKQLQQQKIEQLKQDAIKYEKKARYYDDKDERAKEDKYDAKAEASIKIAQRLESGERLDPGSISNYINTSGNIAKQSIISKQKAYSQRQTQTEKEESVNKYINTQLNQGKKVELSYITKKFDIPLAQANIINKNVNSQVNLQKTQESASIKKIEQTLNTITPTISKQLEISNLNLQKSYSPEAIKNIEKYSFYKLPSNTLSAINKLPKAEKDAIYNYQLITQAQKSIPTSSELSTTINNIQTTNKIISQKNNLFDSIEKAGLKYGNKKFKKNNIITISTKDIDNINKFKSISNSNIKKAISEGKINKFNDYVESINNINKTKQKINITQLNDLVSAYQNKISKSITGKNLKLVKFGQNKFIQNIAYTNILNDLNNKIKKGQTITANEYLEYKKSLGDLLGIKELTKNVMSKNKNQPLLITSISLIKFLSKATLSTVKIIYRDLVAIGSLGITGIKYISRNTINRLSIIYSDLSGQDKQAIDNLIKKDIATINTTKNITKALILNPAPLILGGAILISKGQKSIRKAIINNPAQVVGEIASFFVGGSVVGKIAKGTRIVRSKVSPFVLKNVKVFSEGASLSTTAKALTKLEGKTINLFSATPHDLKKIFETTSITKKEANILIKDMLNNPINYIGDNLKIKKLDSIIRGNPKSAILNFMKITKEGILAGSASLKLQLGKFRKVGDLDILVKNPNLYANKLIDYLNNKNLLGKILNKNRYAIHKTPNLNVYRVWDKGFKGTRKYNEKYVIADIDLILEYEKQFSKAGKITSKDIRKIGGINVFKAEAQLPRKAELLLQSTKARRYEKELNDIKLITSKINKNINAKEYNSVKKLLDKEKNMFKVRGFADSLSAKRKWGWAEEILGDLNLKFKKSTYKDAEVIRKLKRKGFDGRKINAAINNIAPNDMYFAPNVIYSHYLIKNGKIPKGAGIIYAKNIKISKYPKNIQQLIKKNIQGLLSTQEQTKLKRLMREIRVKNPDNFFIGQEAIGNRVGELEVLLSEFSKLYAKKYFINRKVYIPVLDQFVKVQEVTLGKQPKTILNKLYNAYSSKMKKGYSIKEMKKDINNFSKKFLKDSKENVKKIKQDFTEVLKKQSKIIDDEIVNIQKSKLTKSEKETLIKNLRRVKKTIKRKNISKLNIISKSNRIIKQTKRKIEKTIPRKTGKIKRPVKRVTKTVRKVKIVKRPIKRVKRPVKRATAPIRTPIRTPKRPVPITIKIPKIPKKPKRIKIPKLDLSFNNKLPKGMSYKVDAYAKKGQKRIKIVSGKPINKAWNTVFNKGTRKYNSVDKSVSRSFEFKLVGITKVKDDIKKINMQKVRPKKSNNPKVLSFVEKSKYAIDTRGEKKGLKISKKYKKQTTKTRKTKKRKRK